MTFREHDCCETVIYGLKAYTHYEIRVAASNVAGDGPLSMPFTVKTAEAGWSNKFYRTHFPFTLNAVNKKIQF